MGSVAKRSPRRERGGVEIIVFLQSRKKNNRPGLKVSKKIKDTQVLECEGYLVKKSLSSATKNCFLFSPRSTCSLALSQGEQIEEVASPTEGKRKSQKR